jgi:exodeoxyribonuclease V beta subunit
MPQIHDTFNPCTVPLQQTNLIEASAGTGKTYSLALLALRLLIKRRAAIDQILMVTYTNAAVAELEIRVRSFIRKALVAARGETGEIEEDIRTLVEEALIEAGREKVISVLSDAELMLDQTAIMTIHGFCQKSLIEYAFETGQLFRSETLDPEVYDVLIKDAFNHIWRNYIATIPDDFLTGLIAFGLTHKSMLGKVSRALSGNIIYSREPIPADFLTPTYFDRERSIYQQRKAALNQTETQIRVYLENHWDDLYNEANSRKAKPKKLLSALSDRDIPLTCSLLAKLDYQTPAFIPLLEMVREHANQLLEQKKYMLIILHQLAVFVFKKVETKIKLEFARRGTMTFDDMINRLHHAVCCQEHSELIQKIRKRYLAIFVDEFQDTDRFQYEIFHKIFQENEASDQCLFYIGDPKQLIYSWRKADLNTYFKASESVDHIYRMKTNHRSHPDYIKAMNYFFHPKEESNFFHFDSTDTHRIEYEQVDAVLPTKKARLFFQGTKPPPLQIITGNNKSDFAQGTVALVQKLLDKELYTLNKDGKPDPVRPGDIGIIVRANAEGTLIKELLSTLRIPAVTIQDDRILQTDEAKDLYYFLQAVMLLTRAAIHRSLLTNMSGWSAEKILKVNDEKLIDRFRQYQENWKEKGVYLVLRRCLSDCRLVSRLFESQQTLTERSVANYFHLVELLHATEQKKSFNPEELLQWLKKGIDGELKSGDEFIQRLESDAEAVNIVTVHKSKGLEYKIVLLPYMELKRSTRTEVQFRNSEGVYYTAESALITPEEKAMQEKQEEQENKRLLYVAVTRACSHCFVFSKPFDFDPSTLKTNDSVLKKTLTLLSPEEMIKKGVDFMELPFFDPTRVYQPESSSTIPVYSQVPDLELPDAHWQTTSYSSLNTEHAVLSRSVTEQSDTETEFDRFVFRTLPRGAHIGNMLHLILEKIDFTDEYHWERIIERSLRSHLPSADLKWVSYLQEMVRHIVHAIVPADENAFTLSRVVRTQRLNELEFDLPLKRFSTRDVTAFSTPQIPLRLRSVSELEGILNGKMDLFFEYQNRYYLFDWKTNYLGSSLEAYNPGKIAESMEEHNYHLQYHLYILAVSRYLRNRLPDYNYTRDFGGVAYLFLRGMRTGSSQGIYFYKPTEATIDTLESILLKSLPAMKL